MRFASMFLFATTKILTTQRRHPEGSVVVDVILSAAKDLIQYSGTQTYNRGFLPYIAAANPIRQH